MNEELQRELFLAFKDAVEHLEYCGYGDSWERSCAMHTNMPSRLQTVLEKAAAALNIKLEDT